MLAARTARQGTTRTLQASTAAVRPAFVATTPQLIRGYAAPAEAGQSSSRPPIQLFGVDGTYASALYTAASKTSTLDPTAKTLTNLHKTITTDPKLRSILHAPTLSSSDKNSITTELLKTASVPQGKDGETIRNFLATLAENNRLGVLGGVCERFEELMAAGRGEVEVRVTSAEELDRRTLGKVEASVKNSKLGGGRKLKVVSRVQPDIRGGLIVEIGDRTIDLSVAAKMSRMNKLLQETL